MCAGGGGGEVGFVLHGQRQNEDPGVKALGRKIPGQHKAMKKS